MWWALPRALPEEILQGLGGRTSRASALRWACTWPWPAWPIARAIPRSACTGRRLPYEEAEHAAKFAELLGEVVTDSTKKNLQMRVEAENGATQGKTELAKKAKELNLDAIHDTVHEMARDEARHGKAFRWPAEALLRRVIPAKFIAENREGGRGTLAPFAGSLERRARVAAGALCYDGNKSEGGGRHAGLYLLGLERHPAG